MSIFAYAPPPHLPQDILQAYEALGRAKQRRLLYLGHPVVRGVASKGTSGCSSPLRSRVLVLQMMDLPLFKETLGLMEEQQLGKVEYGQLKSLQNDKASHWDQWLQQCVAIAAAGGKGVFSESLAADGTWVNPPHKGVIRGWKVHLA